MTATLGDQPLARTEQGYLALGETLRPPSGIKTFRTPWRLLSDQSPGLRASESGTRSTCDLTRPDTYS